MSRLVDERVVQMTFDNTKFDSNIKQSIDSINDLKKNLNFDGVTENINKDLKGVDTSILASSIEEVGVKFSALEIAAITAISNITNRLVDMGVEMAKNLSVDNISAGWDKFADKTKAVGTILGQGYELDEVNKQLERLNWYTDQTSYDFTSMVNSIGKFTATGQKLDESVEAMMGIANWAALSGQNAETASRAMYQISQAMGAGAMRLIDYRSIQNANMDTDEFRQKVLDTAVEMEKLNKITSVTGEVIYETLNGQKFSKGQFTEKLSEGWFDKDVMMRTFRLYSDGIDELYDYTNKFGGSVETAFDEIGDSLDEFGMKAFKAAQEARTFMDAIIATKDAVGSSWMSTFEKVFGTYDEAVELWSNFAVKLWDIFAAGGEARNRALDIWKERGGRDDLFADTGVVETTGAFWNLIYALEEVINVVKEAWRAVFPFAEAAKDEYDGMAMRYKSITEWLQKFAANLRMNEDRANKLRGVLKGFFATIKFGLKLLKAVWDGTKPLRDFVFNVLNKISEKVSGAGNSFTEFVDKTTLFTKVSNTLSKSLTFIINTLTKAWNGINNFIKKLTGHSVWEIIKMAAEKIVWALNIVKTSIENFGKTNTDGVEKVTTDVEKKLSPLAKLVNGIKALLSGLYSLIKAIIPVINQMLSFLGDAFKAIGDMITNAVEKKDINQLLNFENLFQTAFWASFGAYIMYMTTFVRRTMQTFRNVIQGFADVLDSKALMQYAEAIKTLAIALLIMVAAIVLLAGVDEQKLTKAMSAVIILMSTMAVFMKVLMSMFKVSTVSMLGTIKNGLAAFAKAKSLEIAVKSLLALAGAVLIMAVALKILTSIKEERMIEGLMAMTTIVMMLVVAAKIISKNKRNLVLGAPALLTLALSTLILAQAVKSLAKLDDTSLKRGLIGIGVITAMVAALAVISKKTSALKLVPFAMSMTMIAVAFAILAGSMKLMSYLEPADILKGVAILAAFSAILVLVSKSIKMFGAMKLIVFSAGVLTMAIAFSALAGCIKAMGTLEPTDILKGIVVMTSFLALLAVISKSIKFMGGLKLTVFSVAITSLAVAFSMLANVIRLIGNMETDTLLKGSTVVLGLTAFMVAITKAIGLKGTVSLFIFGQGLLAIGVGMLALAGAVSVLGKLSWTQLAVGMVGLVAALAALVIVAKVLQSVSPSLLITSVSMALMAAAIALVVSSITLLLATLSLFGNRLSELLTNIAKAINENGPAMTQALTTIITSLLEGLTNSLGSLFNLLSGVLDGLLNLLVEFGPRIIKVVLDLITELIKQLAEHFPELAESIVSMIVTLLDSIKNHLGEIIDIVMDMLVLLLQKLNERIPEVIDEVGNLIVTVVEAAVAKIVEITPKLISAAFDLILGLIDGLGQALEDNAEKIRDTMIKFGEHIINAFKKLFGINSPSTIFEGFGKNIVQGLINGIKQLISSVLDVIEMLFDRVFNAISKFINKSFSEGAKFIKELLKGMKSIVSELLSSIRQWVDDILGIVRSLVQGMFGIGEDIMDGLFNGIKKGMTAPLDLIGDIGNSIKDGFCNLFGIHSPSRVFAEYGMYMDEGLALGLRNNAGVITNSFQTLGDAVEEGIDKSGMSEAVSSIADNMDLTPDGTITITPVLDLSEIQNGTEQMNSMLKSGNYSIGGSAELARKTSDELNSRRFNTNRINEVSNKQQINPANQTGTMNITFNITGTNAKEIADEVSKVMQDQVTRRKLNWA